MTPGSLAYVLVDVFAEQPFAGNQLAVVLGGDGLSTRQMQAIASEFNLAETTFPVALTDQDVTTGADYRVRIFTASEEIPFAGHPTLGTAWVLARRGELMPGERLQACGAGLIGVQVPADAAQPVELRSQPRDLLGPLSREAAVASARSIGLGEDDLAGDAYVAGCGLTFLHLPVTPAALTAAHVRQSSMDDVDLGGATSRDPLIGLNAYAVVPPSGDEHDWHLHAGADGVVELTVRSRVFVPGPSVPEDPATGSAAVGLGIALVASGVAHGDGLTRYEIAQGVELGRPSRLSGRVEARDGIARTCWVGGLVQPIGEGRIAVPCDR